MRRCDLRKVGILSVGGVDIELSLCQLSTRNKLVQESHLSFFPFIYKCLFNNVKRCDG